MQFNVLLLTLVGSALAVPDGFAFGPNSTTVTLPNTSALNYTTHSIAVDTVTFTPNCNLCTTFPYISTVFVPIYITVTDSICPSSPSDGFSLGNQIENEEVVSSGYYPYMVTSGSTSWINHAPPSVGTTVTASVPATILITPVPVIVTADSGVTSTSGLYSTVTTTSTTSAIVTVVSIVSNGSSATSTTEEATKTYYTTMFREFFTTVLVSVTSSIKGSASPTPRFSLNDSSVLDHPGPIQFPPGSVSMAPYSSDGRCGTGIDTRCLSGSCCSQFGYCGNTSDFCGFGCQSMFGDCVSLGDIFTSETSSSTTTSMSIPTSSASDISMHYPLTTTFVTTIPWPHSIQTLTTTETILSSSSVFVVNSSALGTLHLNTKSSSTDHKTSRYWNNTLLSGIKSTGTSVPAESIIVLGTASSSLESMSAKSTVHLTTLYLHSNSSVATSASSSHAKEPTAIQSSAPMFSTISSMMRPNRTVVPSASAITSLTSSLPSHKQSSIHYWKNSSSSSTTIESETTARESVGLSSSNSLFHETASLNHASKLNTSNDTWTSGFSSFTRSASYSITMNSSILPFQSESVITVPTWTTYEVLTTTSRSTRRVTVSVTSSSTLMSSSTSSIGALETAMLPLLTLFIPFGSEAITATSVSLVTDLDAIQTSESLDLGSTSQSFNRRASETHQKRVPGLHPKVERLIQH